MVRDAQRSLPLPGQTLDETLVGAGIGMCLVDPDLRYVWVNDTFADIVRYRKADLIGMTSLELTHPDDIELHRGLAEQVYLREISHFNVRKRFLAGDGTIIACDVLGSGCFDADGQPVIGLGIQTNAKLADPTSQRIETLQRSAAIGQLAASAIHELRTSLASISLAGEALEATVGSSDALALIRHEIGSALALLSSMATFGSPTQTQDGDENTPILSVGALIKQCQGLARLVVPSGTTLSIPSGESELLFPDIAPLEFQQVLINLIINARDATTGDGGAISITTSLNADDPGFADICVSDNGAGMTPAEITQAFEAYFSTKGDAGTGLGLTICRDIVERRGGEILLESQVGAGSTFTIRLPIVQLRARSSRPNAM